MTKKGHAPAAERNRDPILKVLKDCLPPVGTVLEVAAGTGQHAAAFAPALAPRAWLPSDADPEALESIEAWRQDCPENGPLPPLYLDVLDEPWPVERHPPSPALSAIVAVNLLHIAPWKVAEALIAGAGRVLPEAGVLYLYGPFTVDGRHTAPSNAAFDRSLKARNRRWGVRDVGAITILAGTGGFRLERTEPMPANNLSLVYVKR